MKAKKPLLRGLLIVASLAVALIVPAAATGKSDNKPVAWVSYGTNTGNRLLPEQLQLALAVKQLGNEDTVGHLDQKRLKPDAIYQLSRAREFEDAANPDGPASYFYHDGEYELSPGSGTHFPGKVAIIYPIIERLKPEDAPLHAMWVLFDGGEPATVSGDGSLLFIWGPDLPEPGSPMYVGPVTGGFGLPSNVQIHITEDYVNPLLAPRRSHRQKIKDGGPSGPPFPYGATAPPVATKPRRRGLLFTTKLLSSRQAPLVVQGRLSVDSVTASWGETYSTCRSLRYRRYR